MKQSLSPSEAYAAKRDSGLPLGLRLVPFLFFFCLYSGSIQIWFRESDFALVTLAREVHNFRDFLAMMFSPYAQGTIRPWSERAPFLLSLTLFGTNCVPFRIIVLLTAAVDIALIAFTTQRVTGSSLSGFVAPLFWAASASLVSPMSWNSSYNEVQYPIFLLGALACFILYQERGQARFWWLQLAVFILGFGSLENNIVYPGIAIAWAIFVAPTVKRNSLLISTAPLFGISALYFFVHLKIAPLPAGGVYAVQLDSRIFGTFWEYWCWAFLSPQWAELGYSRVGGIAILLIGMSALVVFTGWTIARGVYTSLFFLAWFILTLAPFLPLPDRHSEYYLTVPVMGLAMLAGWGVVVAWQSGWIPSILALLSVFAWACGMLPVVRATTRHYIEESKTSKALMLGSEEIRKAHPNQAILIDGIDDEAYRVAISGGAFHALGIEDVYFTPGSETRVHSAPDDEGFASAVVDPVVAIRAVRQQEAVVYSFARQHLYDITRAYGSRHVTAVAPRRVEVGSRLYSYMLGPEWLKLQDSSRWMPGEASLRIAGPGSAADSLLLSGYCWEEQLKRGPLTVTVWADDLAVGRATLKGSETRFRLRFPLPSSLSGRELMTVRITVDPPIRVDGQDYGLIFGTVALTTPPAL